MASRSDVSEFLKTRRARITPAQAGIREFGRARRVPGLKREEVALLAGVSTEYYARLERGDTRGVSDSVLSALARALQLDDAERVHLFDLAKATSPAGPVTNRVARPTVRPSIARLLDSMSATPAYLRNARFDIVMANGPCFALYAGVLTPDALPLNLARFLFLDPRAREFFIDWGRMADDITSALRVEAGKSPGDQALSRLVGELATGSAPFATRWARHDVRFHVTSTKRLRTSLVGEIELTGDALDLAGDGLTLIAYTAEPASRAQEQLDLLISWALNHAETEPHERIPR
ncbi:MAG TPA: helix-turn-helix transcriptional regulator [Gaiellaceae bacterium]|jgi:transcriptional regulator with XRE-family HTH domain|nr:helix-turn-helix transcriptional regulator [Gaiellaceae bacterium]